MSGSLFQDFDSFIEISWQLQVGTLISASLALGQLLWSAFFKITTYIMSG